MWLVAIDPFHTDNTSYQEKKETKQIQNFCNISDRAGWLKPSRNQPTQHTSKSTRNGKWKNATLWFSTFPTGIVVRSVRTGFVATKQHVEIVPSLFLYFLIGWLVWWFGNTSSIPSRRQKVKNIFSKHFTGLLVRQVCCDLLVTYHTDTAISLAHR